MTKPVKRKAKGSVRAWGFQWPDGEIAGGFADLKVFRLRADARAFAHKTSLRVRPIRITVLKGRG